MSELIKREDAINAVEMFFKDAYIEDADVHCNDMVYEINHIPTASPWHRVEEELPEPRFAREWYLVALESGCVKTLAFEKAEKRWHETGSPVTHWMPLPEPPKEDA